MGYFYSGVLLFEMINGKQNEIPTFWGCRAFLSQLPLARKSINFYILNKKNTLRKWLREIFVLLINKLFKL